MHIFGTSTNSFKHSIVPRCLICAFGSIFAAIGSIWTRSSTRRLAWIEPRWIVRSVYLILVPVTNWLPCKDYWDWNSSYSRSKTPLAEHFSLVRLWFRLGSDHFRRWYHCFSKATFSLIDWRSTCSSRSTSMVSNRNAHWNRSDPKQRECHCLAVEIVYWDESKFERWSEKQTSLIESALPLFPLIWERLPHALFPPPMGLTRSVSFRLPSMVSFVSDELTKAIVSPETVASLRERWLKRSDCKLHSIEDIRWHVVEFPHRNCDNWNRDEAPEMDDSIEESVGRRLVFLTSWTCCLISGKRLMNFM